MFLRQNVVFVLIIMFLEHCSTYPLPKFLSREYVGKMCLEYLHIWAKSTGQMSGVKLPHGPNETGRFHTVSPNFRRAYVTLQKFTPDLQKFYTDIFVISVTFCKSVKLIRYDALSRKLHTQESEGTKSSERAENVEVRELSFTKLNT